MGNILAPVHLIIILLVVLVFFRSGRIADFMGDLAKGIKAFKTGMKEEQTPAQGDAPYVPVDPLSSLEMQAEEVVESPSVKTGYKSSIISQDTKKRNTIKPTNAKTTRNPKV
ncbi:twin-arginine translocase TatA/TatE family subunit [Bartonella sp. DGB2]|uniref:twin-arginine translocase TatA/TatE family subunit n=1 Tax=Bartonella sp. DGB2 TaxID=3388426 RepID=UPI00398FF1E1